MVAGYQEVYERKRSLIAETSLNQRTVYLEERDAWRRNSKTGAGGGKWTERLAVRFAWLAAA